jgi:DNA-directed RNA polymerase subunit RPC12/RpoP
MKFICGNCKAKYQIADEKIGRRTLSMVCRQCGKEILIQPPQRASGEIAAPRAGHAQLAQMAAPAPSVLTADFHRQVIGGVREKQPFPAASEWHVAINDIPVGPMHREEVARKIALGAVTGDSLAWREGLDDWMPARNIPELAVLFLKPSSPPSAAAVSSDSVDHSYAALAPRPPEKPIQPAARSAAVPIGGRLDVPQTIDEFLPPIPLPAPNFEQIAVSPLSSETKVQPQQGQSWGPMFVMVCGGALIMMIGVVVGVKMLGNPSSDEKAEESESSASLESDGDRQGAGEIIKLELQEIGGEYEEEQAENQLKKSTATGQKSGAASASKGKALSKEEKAMLERMGGNLDQNPSQIVKLKSSSGAASSSQKSGLKAEQLAAVVGRGKQQLKRCYEAALRTNPSDETIRLDIDLTVGMSGTVTKMSTRGKSLGEMNDCIKRTIRMWRFPASGNETRTSFPVVFQPGV